MAWTVCDCAVDAAGGSEEEELISVAVGEQRARAVHIDRLGALGVAVAGAEAHDGREVDDDILPGEGGLDGALIANVAAYQLKSGRGRGGEQAAAARFERIQDGDVVTCLQEGGGDGGADVTRAAGDEDAYH